MLTALGARGVLLGPEGERDAPLASLYKDDEIDYLAKRPDELVTALLVPSAADAGHLPKRVLEAAASRVNRLRGAVDGGRPLAARWSGRAASIVLGAVGSRLPRERVLQRKIVEAARLARQAAKPMDNTDLQAQWRGLATLSSREWRHEFADILKVTTALLDAVTYFALTCGKSIDLAIQQWAELGKQLAFCRDVSQTLDGLQ
jgi:hypothetical protein